MLDKRLVLTKFDEIGIKKAGFILEVIEWKNCKFF